MRVLTKTELRNALEQGFSSPLTPDQIKDFYEFCLESINVAHLPRLLWVLTAEHYEVASKDMIRQ
jgi:hypothetical protein